MSRPQPAPPDPGEVDAAIERLTPVERALWGDRLRRELARPGSRTGRLAGTDGVTSAVHLASAGRLFLPGLLCFLLSVPLLAADVGAARLAGWALAAVLGVSLLTSGARLATAARARREFRLRGPFR